ncbi:Cof-type HAD-IIB family hydrolase [Sphaerochaeta sp. PS]|uniref:Cof-type HAD-IIB family hydrolase n=1 Tax=Sphaerochaeta sp. PS TaxID=3076336 RepID=UPI0028A3F89A|nr:Cof-type HAD-IIB family hydrolase [Sphaerochaeta sp. PS]MDT4763204.1 Cof-type HAD-IIB family hydrolase [Sphaerochaeta sp. PS]
MFDCKLICTDIDGTLLDGNHKISPENRRVIAKAYRKGITIALISGRKASSLELLQAELGIHGPLGCYSGALVVDEGKILASHPITWKNTKEVLSFVEGMGLESFIYTDKRWYIQKESPWMAFETSVSHTEGKVVPFDELPEHCTNNNEIPYKILCMSEDISLVLEAEKLLHRKFSQALNIYRSGPRYLEISAKDVDKGHALEEICRAYGYETSQAMAIGDYFNDLGMLKVAGHSVAMANAPDEVKRHAHTVTASNLEDGLAKAIEAIL